MDFDKYSLKLYIMVLLACFIEGGMHKISSGLQGESNKTTSRPRMGV